MALIWITLLVIASFNSAEPTPESLNPDLQRQAEMYTLMPNHFDEVPVKRSFESKKKGLRLSVSNNIDVLRAKLFNGMGSLPNALLPRIQKLRYGGASRNMRSSRRNPHARFFRGSDDYSEFKRNTRLMWRSKMSNFVNTKQVPIGRLGR